MARKFTIFALFYFVFEGKFQVQAPRGADIRRGDLTEGFLRYDFGALIFGGAYTWRGLFSEFYGIYVFARKTVFPHGCESRGWLCCARDGINSTFYGTNPIFGENDQ